MTEVERRLANLTWGDHVCVLHARPAEWIAAAAPYVREGLRRGDACTCVIAAGDTDDLISALGARGVDVDRALAEGLLRISSPEDLVAGGRPGIDRLLRRRTDGRSARGAVRLVVDVTSALDAGLAAESVETFESRAAGSLRRARASSLCLYDRRRTPPEILDAALRLHEWMAVRDAVLENHYFEPTAVGRGSGSGTVAGRVDWRLEALWRRRLAEEERATLAERERVARAAAQAARGVALLAEAGAVLSSPLDSETTLLRLARLAVRDLADFAVVDLRDTDGLVRRVATAHRELSREDLTDRLRAFPPRPDLREGVARVLRTGEPLLVRQVGPACLRTAAAAPEHLAVIEELNPSSVMIAPLRTRGETVGALTLARAGQAFSAADLSLATELASRAALAVENARLYARARDAIRRRDEVLAIVSHDLRDPIGAIHAVADLLQEAPGAGREIRKQAGAIAAAARGALNLIENLLDVSRLEAGALPAGEARACDLAPLVSEVCAMFEPYARRKRLRLESVVDGMLPAVMADPERLMQVLTNLVGNALKFTDEGQVVVRVEGSGGEVRVSVSDSGPGLTDEERVHMFDRFWYAVQKRRAGAGLGLAICKGIVEAYGGRIWADSRIGEGSTFHFTLPVGQAS